MLDFSSILGKKIESRLHTEQTIWLTTVDASNTPQPRPVWFHWDGSNVLIFSQEKGAKVRHIKRNPRVALNLNTSFDGGNVGVIIGTAQVVSEPLPAARMEAYLKKYEKDIKAIGLTPESMQKEYSVAILVTPESLRGF